MPKAAGVTVLSLGAHCTDIDAEQPIAGDRYG